MGRPALQRKGMPWVLYLRIISLSCRWDSQGRSQGKVSVKYSLVLQVSPFRVIKSSLIGQ